MFEFTAVSVTINARKLGKVALNLVLFPGLPVFTHSVSIESVRVNKGFQYEHESDSFPGGIMSVNGLP